MQKNLSFILSVSLLAITLIGCTQKQDMSGTNSNKSDKISIVTTIFPPYDFARAIAGDKADLTLLIKPGAETHSYEPSPGDIIKIQNADVFLYIGGENEEWVKTIIESMDTSNKKVIKLMDCVTPVEEETVDGMEAEKEEAEASGHEVEYDEHIWTSPKNAILMISRINEALCEIDGKNAGTYIENTAAYTKDIQQLDDEIRTIVEASQNKLLVFGDRFPFRYFVDEFGLEYRAAFNGCSTETEASAGTLAYLIDTVKENSIPYIYHIELSNENIAKAICEQTGAEMLLLHSCHNLTKDSFEAGDTYLSLMKSNAENLRKGLN